MRHALLQDSDCLLSASLVIVSWQQPGDKAPSKAERYPREAIIDRDHTVSNLVITLS